MRSAIIMKGTPIWNLSISKNSPFHARPNGIALPPWQSPPVHHLMPDLGIGCRLLHVMHFPKKPPEMMPSWWLNHNLNETYYFLVQFSILSPHFRGKNLTNLWNVAVATYRCISGCKKWQARKGKDCLLTIGAVSFNGSLPHSQNHKTSSRNIKIV